MTPSFLTLVSVEVSDCPYAPVASSRLAATQTARDILIVHPLLSSCLPAGARCPGRTRSSARHATPGNAGNATPPRPSLLTDLARTRPGAAPSPPPTRRPSGPESPGPRPCRDGPGE